MKTILLMASLILFNQATFADTERKEIERSRKVVSLAVPLNTATVRCLVGDYGSQSLKISMAALKPHTVFRQTTRGETEPCINAGSCVFDRTPDGRRLSPELILDDAKPVENVEVTILLKEVLSIDHDAKVCGRSLQEDVSAMVRGLKFEHSDGEFLGTLDYETCVRMN